MMKAVRGQRIDTIFVLIIFCIFAVSVLMVLMFGASIYQNMTEISREDHDERTVLSYIRTKVRTSDEGTLYVGEFQGLPALCYDEEIGEVLYHTFIYHYDGCVYELFSEADLDFYPEDGTKIMELDDLSFEALDNRLIKVSAGTKQLLLFPRSTAGYGSGMRLPGEVILE